MSVFTGDDDGQQGRNVILSLIENSIDRIALTRDEFETKAGVSFDDHDAKNDDSLFVFRGNWSRVIRQAQTKKNKKSLRSTVRNWLDKLEKNTTKISDDTSPTSSSAPERSLGRTLGSSNDRTTTCPKALYELYVERARSDLKIHDGVIIENDWSVDGADLGGNFMEQRTSNSLAFYCNGILLEGEINDSHCHSEKDAGDKTSILQCAAYLYYQIWYFRVLQGRDVSQAYGFSMSLLASFSQQPELLITLLMLEKPSMGPIGGQYKLYEYTQRHKLLGDNDKTEFVDLGKFVASAKHPNPFAAMTLVADRSPGCAMLLPLKGNDYPGCKVVPTLNGSLVMRTRPGSGPMHTHIGGIGEFDNDEEEVSNIFQRLADVSTNSKEEFVDWYIKYKTPASFGTFYDTAEIAINGSRRMLQTRLAQKTLGGEQKAVALEFLRMHPVDAYVSKYRSVSMSRDMGSAFVGPEQLSWIQFKTEFLFLMRRVLVLQDLCNLVHGDIYYANVLFDDKAGTGSQLVLIDWDEALRKQPCYRRTLTEEERLRYPNGLVNFPLKYTKHQFLHLFQYYLQNMYHKETINEELQKTLSIVKKQSSGMVASVDKGFTALSRFLQL